MYVDSTTGVSIFILVSMGISERTSTGQVQQVSMIKRSDFQTMGRGPLVDCRGTADGQWGQS